MAVKIVFIVWFMFGFVTDIRMVRALRQDRAFYSISEYILFAFVMGIFFIMLGPIGLALNIIYGDERR